MPAGRPPKPTALKVLNGTARPDRTVNEPSPSRTAVTPPAPRHLSPEAKREWRRIAKELHRLQLLTRVDTEALAMYCETWATWVDATEKLRASGLIIRTNTGYPMQNPLLSVINKCESQLRAWMREFGMTPSSRSRINVPKESEQDDYEAFLNGTG